MFKEKCHNNKMIINELHRLKCQLNYLEKVNGTNKVIEKLSSNNAVAKQYLDKYKECRNYRNCEISQCREQLTKINDGIDFLRNAIIDDENLQKHDLHYYEKHVLEVEGRLKFIKSKIKSEVDALESDTEFNDINVLISRLKKKAAQVEAFGSKCSIMSSANIIVKNKEQKNSVDSSILTDPNGKWTSEEHALFLRAKHRYKENSQALIKAIQKVMPDMSEKEICDHDSWYKKYLNAREEQREEIRKWREEKRSSTSQDDSSQYSSGCDNISQRDHLCPTSKEAQMRDRKERAETKRRIEKWKQLKIDKKRAEEEERAKMIKEIREKDCYKTYKSELRNEAVVEWKTKRRMEAQKVLMQKEIDRMHSMQRSAEANRTLPDFRAQDQKYIARRREASLSRLTTARPPLRVRACFPSLQRDPGHAMRPTEASVRREHQPNINGYQQGLSESALAEEVRLRDQARSLSVRNIPKLKSPSWRQETNNA